MDECFVKIITVPRSKSTVKPGRFQADSSNVRELLILGCWFGKHHYSADAGTTWTSLLPVSCLLLRSGTCKKKAKLRWSTLHSEITGT